MLIDPDKEWVVKPPFATKGNYTPFLNKKLYGDVLLTVYDGKVVYKNI